VCPYSEITCKSCMVFMARFDGVHAFGYNSAGSESTISVQITQDDSVPVECLKKSTVLIVHYRFVRCVISVDDFDGFRLKFNLDDRYASSDGKALVNVHMTVRL